MHMWPYFEGEASRFSRDHLRRPRSLLKEFTARGKGSGRRSGPRDLLWQSVVSSAVAALEAGLEDLIFAAHAARLGVEGAPIRAGINTPQKKPRNWLVETRLMAPSAVKLERILFADFGVMLGPLPGSALFTVMRKSWSKGGSGRGAAKPGPKEWSELRDYLDTLAYIRNAAAHADVGKLDSCPSYCLGDLWLQKEDGAWSVQQPHGLTAVRTALAIFNTTAEALSSTVGKGQTLSLSNPDSIDLPPTGSSS